MAQTGKVRVTKQEILGLIGKGGKKHANDTDKKALKEFLDAGKDGTFFIKKTGNTEVFQWPNIGSKGKPKTVYIFADGDTVDNVKKAYRKEDSGKADSFKGQIGTHPVQLVATGKTEGIAASTITKMQELGSLEVFKAGIKRNKEFKSAQSIRDDATTMKALKKIWKDLGGLDTVDNEWLDNFYKQQEVLLGPGGIGSRTVTEFDHSGPGSFMAFITKEIKRLNIGVSGKDNWDPADIWLIRNQKEAETKIKAITRQPNPNFEEFQTTMRLLFNAHKQDKNPMVFGISLKKVAKGTDAQIEFVNHELAFFKRLEGLKLKHLFSKCNLDKKNDKNGNIVMGSQDTRFVIGDAINNQYDFQIKGNNSTGFSNLKYEPTASGATAARLGKATVDLVVSEMKKNYNLNFKKENSEYPMDISQLRPKKDEIIRKIKFIQSKGVDTVERDAEKCYNNLAFTMKDAPWTTNTKLQQINWLSLIHSLPKEKLNNFCTQMLFMAKKEGTRYGPFAKIF